ncbi:MAG TPA: TetR/AcrR family transcriptional regulator [Conexibacter sp.]|jgi:AcrR family transcriptional regulator
MATKPRRARATARNTRKREQEVFDTAAEIFYKHSYADATVQDVADALGILKGSLYYYIKTKEDLLFRLLEQVHDEVDEILRATAEESVELEPLERLELYVRRQTEYNLKNLVKITVYYHDLDRLSAERRRAILRRRKAHEDFVGGLIRAAQASGAVDPGLDAGLLRNCVFSTIIWTFSWYQPRGRFKASEIADLCARFALGGVTAGGVRPALPALPAR